MKQEDSLDDVPAAGFESSTLQFDNASIKDRQHKSSIDEMDSDGLLNGNVDEENRTNSKGADRPKSLALIPWSGQSPKDFFSYRDGLISAAVEECRANVMNEDDGALLGAWMLTEISFWDNEKERLVLLTTKSLISIKYDFITLQPLDSRRIPLDLVDTVFIGDLSYPSTSIIPSRNMGGVRVMWNQGKPLSFVKKWNPFEKDIPFSTFTSHPLLWHTDGDAGERKMFNTDDFSTHLKEALQWKIKSFQCSFQHRPIVLENYAGVGSLIHNKNSLGFFKVRGKFSF